VSRRVIRSPFVGLVFEGSTDSELETPQPVDKAGDRLSGPKISVLHLRGRKGRGAESGTGERTLRHPSLDPREPSPGL
jgi:hypothetical protein